MMMPILAITAGLAYFWSHYMNPCEEKIVVALERAGVDVALDAENGVVTVALAVRAIEHIATCWRDEAARAITRGRDAKRWEARAKTLEKDLIAERQARHANGTEVTNARAELDRVKADASAKIAEQGATIERLQAEVRRLAEAQMATAQKKGKRR